MDKRTRRIIDNPQSGVSHVFYIVFCHGMVTEEIDSIIPKDAVTMCTFDSLRRNVKIDECDVETVVESDRVAAVSYIEPDPNR